MKRLLPGLFILTLTCVVLFVFSSLFNENDLDSPFQYLLSCLESFEPIPFPDFFTTFEISADWGVANFIRDIINFYGSFMALFFTFCSYVIQILYFLVHVIRCLFINVNSQSAIYGEGWRGGR